MALEMKAGTYVQAHEAAPLFGWSVGHFSNKRSQLGDSWLQGHELIPGRIFFKLSDVERLAREVSG
jgi:hypothetical protein